MRPFSKLFRVFKGGVFKGLGPQGSWCVRGASSEKTLLPRCSLLECRRHAGRRSLGRDAAKTLAAKEQLVALLLARGRSDDAELYQREVRRGERALLGPAPKFK